MQITKNFSLAELTKTNVTWANNQPNAVQLENLKRLAREVLQPLRDRIGSPIMVNSGFRSKAVNLAVRGSLTSQHSLGEAADIECPAIGNDELARVIIRHLQFDQLILEHYIKGQPTSGWVHVSYRKNRLRHQILTKPHNRNVYLPGLQI